MINYSVTLIVLAYQNCYAISEPNNSKYYESYTIFKQNKGFLIFETVNSNPSLNSFSGNLTLNKWIYIRKASLLQ